MLHNLIERLKQMPTWQKWLLAALFVAVVGLALYMRHKNSQEQQTTGSSGLLNGSGLYDIYGNPLYGNQTPTSGGGVPGGGGMLPTLPGTGSGALSNFFGTIRSKGVFPGFDKTHTGVPLRSSPGGGGSILSYVGFGTTGVTITGAPVTGPLNQQGGSNLWYPVSVNGQSGYISAQDLFPVTLPKGPSGGLQTA